MLDRTCHVSLRFSGRNRHLPRARIAFRLPVCLSVPKNRTAAQMSTTCDRVETPPCIVCYVHHSGKRDAKFTRREEAGDHTSAAHRGTGRSVGTCDRSRNRLRPLLQQIMAMRDRPGEAVIAVAANGRGLSVATISYYVVGLLGYLIKGYLDCMMWRRRIGDFCPCSCCRLGDLVDSSANSASHSDGAKMTRAFLAKAASLLCLIIL